MSVCQPASTVVSALTGHGRFSSRFAKQKDSLPYKRRFCLPSGLTISPLTGCINANRSYLKLDARLKHMLGRLLAQVADNLGAAQYDEMISRSAMLTFSRPTSAWMRRIRFTTVRVSSQQDR